MKTISDFDQLQNDYIELENKLKLLEKRSSSKDLDLILGNEFKVLDHGFVRVVDYMGNDKSIENSARVSYGGHEKNRTEKETRKLIRYLLRHKHTTPFEMCEIKFHIKMPLMIARQWIRHRTANVNEYSARYSVLDNEFYIPSPEQLAAQSTKNHQGRGDEPLSEEESQQVINILKDDSSRCYDNYKLMMNKYDDDELINPKFQGVAKEIARMNLPTNIYTQWYWKIDLHNLLHFLNVRSDSHAQYEIREYANIMLDIVKQWVPIAYEAFIDYVKEGYTLSKMEIEAITDLLFNHTKDLNSYGMCRREVDEFRHKFGL